MFMPGIFRLVGSLALLTSLLFESADAQTPTQPPIPGPPQVSYGLLTEAEEAQERRIQAALAKRISFDWKAVPLKDVIAQLADECDITIAITKKIEDAGVSADQPITRKVVNASLRSTLRLILGDLNLTYMIKDDILKITTIEDAQAPQSMTIRLYPVLDLVDPKPTKDARVAFDFDPLIALVLEVEPDSWHDVGGPGMAKGFDKAACLFISQRDDVHERIGSLMTTLRKVKAVQGMNAPSPPAVRNRYLEK